MTETVNKLTFVEILQKLHNEGISTYDFANEDYYSPDLGLGNSRRIRQDSEGHGEPWWSITHFIDQDVYIKIEGTDDEDDGAYFDEDYYECCSEVDKNGNPII